VELLQKNITATNQGNGDFNYTYKNSDIVGEYINTMTCKQGGNNGTGTFTVEITPTGDSISKEAQASSVTRSIVVILIIAVLFFIAFLFITHPPLKWSFFLLAIFFLVMTVNVVSISLSNEAGNKNISNIFDKLGALSYYMYYFVAGLIIFIWIFSIFNTLANKKTMREAYAVGDVRGYKFLK